MPIVGTLTGSPLGDLIVLPAEVISEPLSIADEAILAAQITLFQADLEAILGRAVVRRSHVQEAMWPYLGDRLYVSRGPIASVASVSIGGAAVNANDYVVHRDAIEVMTWLATPGRITVSYVGGWDAPANLPAKQAVRARTIRWWNRRADDDEGVDQSSVEGHSVKWQAEEYTAAELEACSRLRHPDLAG